MEQFPRDILCEWAGATPEIIALHVFGSRARGTARPDSDLDLAIEVDGGSFGPLVKFVLKRAGWIDELRTLTGISVKDLERGVEIGQRRCRNIPTVRLATLKQPTIAQELARSVRTPPGRDLATRSNWPD